MTKETELASQDDLLEVFGAATFEDLTATSLMFSLIEDVSVCGPFFDEHAELGVECTRPFIDLCMLKDVPPWVGEIPSFVSAVFKLSSVSFGINNLMFLHPEIDVPEGIKDLAQSALPIIAAVAERSEKSG